jgi:Meckel syndrome type 1 protein
MTPSTIASPAAASVLPMLLSPAPAKGTGGEPGMAFTLDIPLLSTVPATVALATTPLVAPLVAKPEGVDPTSPAPANISLPGLVAAADDEERHEDADTGTDLPASPDELPLDPALAWLTLAPPVVVPAPAVAPPAAVPPAAAPRAAAVIDVVGRQATTPAPLLPSVALPSSPSTPSSNDLPPDTALPNAATESIGSETIARAVATTALTPLPDVTPAAATTAAALASPVVATSAPAVPSGISPARPVASSLQARQPAETVATPDTAMAQRPLIAPGPGDVPAPARTASPPAANARAARLPQAAAPPSRSTVAAAPVAIPARFQAIVDQPVTTTPIDAPSSPAATTPIIALDAAAPLIAPPITEAPAAASLEAAAPSRPTDPVAPPAPTTERATTSEPAAAPAGASVVETTPSQPAAAAVRVVAAAPVIAAAQPAAFLRQTTPAAPRPMVVASAEPTTTTSDVVQAAPTAATPLATPAARAFGAAIHAAAVQHAEPQPVTFDTRAPDEPATAPPPLAVDALAASDPQPAATAPVELRPSPAVAQIVQAPLDLTQRQWPQNMIARIEGLRDMANAADTSIRLIPDALGRIDVSMRTEGDTIHVEFAAEQAATRQLLQDAAPRLHAAAEDRGLKLGETRVAPAAESATQNNSGGNNQPGGGGLGNGSSSSSAQSAGAQQQQAHSQQQQQQQREAARTTANRAPRSAESTTDSDAADQAGGRIA